MNTPIYDFVKNYAKSRPVRLHMPEDAFWRRMNPVRIQRLYEAVMPQEGRTRPKSGPQQPEGLLDYIRRGGG